MGLTVFAQSQRSLRKHSVIKHINIFAAKHMNIQYRQDKYSSHRFRSGFATKWVCCKLTQNLLAFRTSQTLQMWNDGPAPPLGEAVMLIVIKDALQRRKCYNWYKALLTLLPLLSLFHSILFSKKGLTSEVTKAGRMMQGDQELRATSKLPKVAKTKVPGCWPSTRSTTENRAAGHLRETMARGQSELWHLNYMAHAL